MLLRPATAKALEFLVLLVLLIAPHRTTSTKSETLASDTERKSPLYQSIVLELLSFPLLATDNCQNLCEERTDALVNFLQTGFEGPNLLENITPYNQNPLEFWIDECLAHRVFCIANADIWWTDDDLLIKPESDPETVWSKLKERAKTCSKRPASRPGSGPQCGSNDPVLSKCICRRILFMRIVRNKHYNTLKPSKMERPSESLECNATSICTRLDLRLRLWNSAIGRWFCNHGLLNKQFNIERQGNSRAVPSMCPCSSKRSATKKKFVPCVSEEEFRDTMEAASMTPLQIHSVKTYRVPDFQPTARSHKGQSRDHDSNYVDFQDFVLPRPSLDNLNWCVISEQNVDALHPGILQPGTTTAVDAGMCPQPFRNFPAVAAAYPEGKSHPFHASNQHQSSLETLAPIPDETGSQEKYVQLDDSLIDQLLSGYQRFHNPMDLAAVSATEATHSALEQNVDGFLLPHSSDDSLIYSAAGAAYPEIPAQFEEATQVTCDRRNKRKIDEYSADWQAAAESSSLLDLEDDVSRFLTDEEHIDLDTILREGCGPSFELTVGEHRNINSPLIAAPAVNSDQRQRQRSVLPEQVRWPL